LIAKYIALFAIIIFLNGASALKQDTDIQKYKYSISADEALNNLSNGRPIRDTFINGYLDMGKINKNSSFDGITIERCYIDGDMILSNKKLKSKVSFFKTTFNGTAQIDNNRFEGGANFKHAIFNNNVTFINDSFQGIVNFQWTNFSRSADFSQTQFFGTMEFMNAFFCQEAVFASTIMMCSPSFFKACFNGSALFMGAKINGESDFNPTYFYGNASFFKTQFNNTADFAGSQFIGRAIFSEAIFLKEANFLGAKFEKDADFSSTDFNGDVTMTGTSFNSSINLNEARFSKLKIDWDQINGKINGRDQLIYNGSTYLELIKNFRDLEKFEDADSCYYTYRWNKQQYDPERPLNLKVLDIISWACCGYGVSLTKTISTSLLLMLAFSGWFWFFGRKLEKDALGIEDAVSFSVMTFLQVSGASEKYSGIKSRHKYAILIESLLGWGLMAVFMVVLTRKLIIS
jgi:hypothetical protein